MCFGARIVAQRVGRQSLGNNGIIAIVEDRVITREEVMREIRAIYSTTARFGAFRLSLTSA
ncbi:MAG: hypothetical protein ACLUKN_13375 [Bacilli bacterium]